jgi:hypothetical protein
MHFWRRLTRFRLRTLFVVVSLLSILLAGFAWRRERARRQAEAVATIERLGGRVEYAGQASPLNPGVIRAEPPLPEWQRRWLGKDFFYDVVEISQSAGSPYVVHSVPLFPPFAVAPITPEPPEPEATAANVEAFWQALAKFKRLQALYVYGSWARHGQPAKVLAGFQELRELHIHDAGLTDADLAGLDRLHLLERVRLEDNALGNETARRLGSCHHLRTLDLSNSQLTDRGLTYLATCEKLEYVMLERASISDAGLAQFQDLASLVVLDLDNTAITDEGLRHLSRLEQLESLSLNSTQITGAGLIHLRELGKLQDLRLSECPIDEAGMKAIAQFRALRELDLSRTPVASATFARMQWPKTLERLQLDKTRFDDTCLESLRAHPSIQSVGLLGARVTREGHDAFHAKRPGVLIWLPD